MNRFYDMPKISLDILSGDQRLEIMQKLGSLDDLEADGNVYDPDTGIIRPLNDPGAETAHLPRKLTAEGWQPHPLTMFTDPETGERYRLKLWANQQPPTNNQPPTK